MNRKIYIFYKIKVDEVDPDPELYAYTENKKYADFFLNTRSKKSIIMRERIVDEMKAQLFELNHKMEMLFMNVLTDGINSFDFVTTYGEEFMIGHTC